MHFGSAAERQEPVAQQFVAVEVAKLAAAEAGRCVLSHSVYYMVDVETSAVQPLATADWAVEAHFFLLQKIRSVDPADAVAGWSAVVVVSGAILPFASQGARWASFELATGFEVSASAPSRCLRFVAVQ